MRLNTFEKALIAEGKVEGPMQQGALSELFGISSFEIKTEKILYRQEIIGQSMGNMPLIQLTITKRFKPYSIPIRKRKVLFISSRVHSGETHASYILKSIVNDLIEDN